MEASWNRCHFCGFSGGEYSPHCPSLTPESSKEREDFARGRRDGRSSRKHAEPGNRAYGMGWAKGDAEADEACEAIHSRPDDE